jgi:hypothetical protein
MNKQDILSLKAGEELDELVGERVLNGLAHLDVDRTIVSSKSYSRDNVAMWDIINIFVKNNFKYTVTNNTEYEHSCIFDSLESHKRYIAHCDNLPEAVCKAALMAALGEEQHQIKKKQGEQ